MKKIKILNSEYDIRVIPSEYIINNTLAVCDSDKRYIEIFEDKPVMFLKIPDNI